MKPIQMVDLKGQYNAIKNEIENDFKNIINTTSFINGSCVKEFQTELEKFLNVKHVIPCASGTDALQIALMALNLNPGDEIITTNFSFAATIEVILLLKLKPVLVDIDIATFNIDPEKIEHAITPKTKAIIPVHLFGQSADMKRIMELAEKNNLFVIEDNAQSIGANYFFTPEKFQKVGTIGDIGTTSFFPSKNLGAYGDGGAVFTNNSEKAKIIKSIANHGMSQRYYHTLQAAVLKNKLKHLDSYNQKRQQAAKKYTEKLKNHPNIILPQQKEDKNTHIFHQYTLRIIGKNRDALAKFLDKKNIPYGIYYPVPLHQQKAYKNISFENTNFQNTLQVVNEVISLPMHTELEEEQIEYICNTILSFFK